MTREEALEWINSLVETMINETHGLFPDTEYKDEVYEALDIAIKALEQESVIDKLRAEIKEMTPTYHNSDWSITDLVPMSKVIDIFDKYEAKSEDK